MWIIFRECIKTNIFVQEMQGVQFTCLPKFTYLLTRKETKNVAIIEKELIQGTFSIINTM